MTTPTSTLVATFVGGPTVRLGYAGRLFLTDPTFDEPRSYDAGGVVLTKLAGPGLAPEEIGPVDVVLLSHDQHPDNLDLAGRDFLAGVPLTLSTTAAAERLDAVTPLVPWQSHRLEGGTAVPPVVVTAVPAQHGPVGCEPVSGPVIGFVLEATGWPTVYVSGDNASVEVLAAIVARFPSIDVAVLFVGAANVGRFGAFNVTLGAEDAAAVAAILGTSVVLPVHAQDWAHFTEPLSAFVHAYTAASPTARLVTLPRGETVDVV